ncbi:tRNA (adenine(22)-N(1))-methyltransferase [Desulfotomaculum copahuensis]|uniref:SAM-dependent methyltransferase n=1 Tax=Desulfotomaculum copahuensis TaxID=1838280 RepID=A0A1B7LHP3_9FIRM|nr:class I SAM-dependent methyltransferase [Desulfotomaculum copahuensis]OAT85821.1 SAM-dependent methyltransferase [Desulfotomaculum copahuensis]
MELTGRLAAIAAYVPAGPVVADIGTDHARLPIYLVEKGICPRVLATDLHEKPFQSACRAVSEHGLADRIEVRLGDGLRPLVPGEAGVVVVAGMGGNTIRRILAGGPAVLAGVKSLVLQPMADAGDLRRWLVDNGWRLVEESLVEEDGHLYTIMAAEPGWEEISDPWLLEVGPRLVERCDPLLLKHLERIKSEYQRVLCCLARSRSQAAERKALDLTVKLNRIREVLARCR